MTDRYEKIRRALAMGPTPGPYEIYQDGERFYVETTTRQSRCGVFKALGSPESERLANAKLAAACDPDTIRALLAERDALAAEPVKKKDWNAELSSWSDEDFVQVFHECPDLADRLRRVLAEPVKKKPYAQGSALGEFGIIPMCDQVDE